jgi:hypothetical protein
MNLSAPTKGLLWSLLAFAMAFGIYFVFLSKKNSYLADNASGQTMYLSINGGPSLTVGAGQSIKVDLGKGKNSIQLQDEAKKALFDTTFVVNKSRGLLNLAKADYYINRQYYGYNVNKDSVFLMSKINIDGKTYQGDVSKTKAFYSENFYYNLDEDYDGVIKNIDKVESRSKIFRKQDFITYYQQYYNNQ